MKNHRLNRRQLIKSVPLVWGTPIVTGVLIPAHAQTSNPFLCLGIMSDDAAVPRGDVSCRLGVARIFLHGGPPEGVGLRSLVLGMELTNPNHELIRPTTFPLEVTEFTGWNIEIREAVSDCAGVTALSPGLLRIETLGCEAPFEYEVHNELLPLGYVDPFSPPAGSP